MIKYNNNPLVSVTVLTYNSSKYVIETLESIKAQTYENIELIISDDCSKDNSVKVCKKWLEKNKDRFVNSHLITSGFNRGIPKNKFRAVERSEGKYIAGCGADDYWCSNDKLQKQVDILESDSLIGLVHTEVFKLIDASGEIEKLNKDRNFTKFEELLKFNCIMAPTACFRRSLYFKYIKEVDPLNKGWIAEDTPQWLWFSMNSKIKFLDEPTIVYRVIAGSASNTNSSRKHFDFIKSRLSIKKYFIDKYNGSQKALKFIYDDFYKESEYHALKLKEIETVRENIKNLKSKGLIIKPYLLQFFCKYHSNDYVYKLMFFFYKIYNRLKNYLHKTK